MSEASLAETYGIRARAQALLHSAVVWDNHGCMPLRADASFLPQLERYRTAGVNVASLNVGFADISWEEHIKVLSFMRQWIAQRPHDYRLIKTVEDVRSCKEFGKLGKGERFVAERYVVAAGSYTSTLQRQIGVVVPVQPAKGYSVTFDLPWDRLSLSIPVVDDRLHAAVVPLEGAIRVAGTAEFAGFDLTLPPVRSRNLLGLLQEVLPQEQLDPATAKPWCGLRPMSVDGVPSLARPPWRT